jgi:hypothetical protein
MTFGTDNRDVFILAHPLQEEITGAMRGLSYYWSASQTEYATVS